MIRKLLLIPIMVAAFACKAQEFKVEFDKKADFSIYKTFSFGEGEIITAKDQRVIADSIIHRWVKNALLEELTKKGLHRVTDSADLVVSYITGSEMRRDMSKNGPFGLTPGSNPDQTFQRDYKQGSLVIDLTNRKNNKLVWRVNAILTANNPDSEEAIAEVVMRGFKKFSIKPKKGKRKK